MILDQIKQKAENWALERVGRKNMLWNAYVNAYRAGAIENGVVWHDLRKDPNDLPKPSVLYSDVTERVIGVQEIAPQQFISFECRYSLLEKKWRTNTDPYYAEVIAWCEIPAFADGK